mgnify:CR=1 FL=1
MAQRDTLGVAAVFSADAEVQGRVLGPPELHGHLHELADPALVEALDDADREVRREALEALGKIGPDAVEAIPAIVAISVDFTDPLRDTVTG